MNYPCNNQRIDEMTEQWQEMARALNDLSRAFRKLTVQEQLMNMQYFQELITALEELEKQKRRKRVLVIRCIILIVIFIICFSYLIWHISML